MSSEGAALANQCRQFFDQYRSFVTLANLRGHTSSVGSRGPHGAQPPAGIELQSPDEAPSVPELKEYPVNDQPEIVPTSPDRDDPKPGMPEILQ